MVCFSTVLLCVLQCCPTGLFYTLARSLWNAFIKYQTGTYWIILDWPMKSVKSLWKAPGGSLWSHSWLSSFDCRVWDCLITRDKWSSPFCCSFVPVKGWTSKRWFSLWWNETVEVIKTKYDLDERQYPSMSSLSVCVWYICHLLLRIRRPNLLDFFRVLCHFIYI